MSRTLWTLFAALCLLGFGELAHAASGPQLFRKGVKALRKGQYYKAKTLLTQAVGKLPHWGLVHLALARAMRFNGDPPQQIIKHVNKATQLLRNNPRVHYFAGQFWESIGKGRKAVRHYLLAVKLGHFSPRPCLRAARLLISARQGRKALACLNQLRLKGKLVTGLYALLAEARTQAGQLQLAAQDWLLAVSQEPNNLVLLQKAFLFYRKYTPKQRGAVKRQWQRRKARLARRLARLLPKRTRRRLRPLLPSKR